MKAMYVVVYYKDNITIHETEPQDRVSYPARVMIKNLSPKEEYDYAVIEERYYPV